MKKIKDLIRYKGYKARDLYISTLRKISKIDYDNISSRDYDEIEKTIEELFFEENLFKMELKYYNLIYIYINKNFYLASDLEILFKTHLAACLEEYIDTKKGTLRKFLKYIDIDDETLEDIKCNLMLLDLDFLPMTELVKELKEFYEIKQTKEKLNSTLKDVIESKESKKRKM